MTSKTLVLAWFGVGPALVAGLALGRWSNGATPASVAVSSTRMGDRSGGAPAAMALARPLAALQAKLAAAGDARVWRLDREWDDLLRSLGAADFPVAVAASERVPGRAVREGLRAALLRRWAELTPAPALAFAQTLAPPGLRAHAVRAVFAGWAFVEPESAAAALRRFPDKAVGQTIAAELAVALAGRDPAAALALLRETRDIRACRGPLTAIFSSWTPRDPAGALAEAVSLPKPLREAMLGTIAEAWGGAEPAAALAWADSTGEPGERLRLRMAVLDGWADSDAAAAAHWVGRLPAGPERTAAIHRVFQTWIPTDAVAAVGWVGRCGLARDEAKALFRRLSHCEVPPPPPRCSGPPRHCRRGRCAKKHGGAPSTASRERIRWRPWSLPGGKRPAVEGSGCWRAP